MSTQNPSNTTDASVSELVSLVEDLRERVNEQDERIDEIEDERDELRGRVDELENQLRKTDSQTAAAMNKAGSNKDRILELQDCILELQARELEKGAHLEWDHIDKAEINVAGDHLERFTSDGQEWARLPGETDPLERSGETALANADLLPIQQLATMDDDMLANATSKRPDYIAARVWEERGRHSPNSLWQKGSGPVREYLDASDLRLWIKHKMERSDEDMSDDYAKQLVSRTLERIQKLAKDRLYTEKRSHRKDGLKYKERRLILPTDSEIPGETPVSQPPETADVTG